MAALGALLVAVALAATACGRYGPPLRAHERAAKREQGRPAEATAPIDPADPAAVDPVAPEPEQEP
jgi:hypothetical protein